MLGNLFLQIFALFSVFMLMSDHGCASPHEEAQRSLKKLRGSLGSLQNNCGDLSDNLAELQGRLSSSRKSSRPDSVRNALFNLNTSLRGVDGNIATLSRKLATLRGAIKTSSGIEDRPIIFTPTAVPPKYRPEKKVKSKFTDAQIIEDLTKIIPPINPVGLSSIIESYLGEVDYDASLKDRFNPGFINPIRTALARKWVRNAAVRIFHDYTRSFLELVVNACDAMVLPEQSVGKFGMGFFSIFSFLSHQETDGCEILVETCYKDPDADNKLRAYRIIFSKQEGMDQVDVAMQNVDITKFKEQSGTIITIIPKDRTKTFSEATRGALREFVHYLDAYPHLKIKMNLAGGNIEYAGNEKSKVEVLVDLLPDRLMVSDQGTGIPIQIALTKLLVPSISTKGVTNISQARFTALRDEHIRTPKLIEFKGKKDPEKSHLLLEVNGVVVINKQMSKSFTSTDGGVRDLLISMPQVTQLTLARDELAFSPDPSRPESMSFEEEYLKKMIKKTLLQELAQLATSSHKDCSLIDVLFSGLQEWEDQTAAQQIRGRFTNYFKEQINDFLKRNDLLVPIPAEYYAQFKKMLKGARVILLPLNKELINYNYAKCEQYLKTYFDSQIEALPDYRLKLIRDLGMKGKLVAGVKVFFVEPSCLEVAERKPMISSLGLRSSLFVPNTFLDIPAKFGGIKEVVTNIIDAYPDQNFMPYEEGGVQKLNILIDNVHRKRGESPQDVKFEFFTKYDNSELEQFIEEHAQLIDNVARVNKPKIENVEVDQFNYVRSLDAFWANPNNYIWFLGLKIGFYLKSHGFISAQAYHKKDASENRVPIDQQVQWVAQDIIENLTKNWAESCSYDPNNYILFKSYFETYAYFAEKTAPYVVMNYLFKDLLRRYGINVVNKDQAIWIGKTQIWPLQRDPVTGRIKTDLGLLFQSLLMHIEAPSGFSYMNNFRAMRERLLPTSQFSLAGYSRQKIDELLLKHQDEILRAVAYENTFKGSAVDLKMVNTVIDLLVSVGDDAVLTGMKDTVLGLYNKYLNIPDNLAIASGYGSERRKIKSIIPASDLRVDSSFAAFVRALSSYPELQKKLLQFQLADFQSQTRLDYRTQDIEKDFLYMPSVLANTPISVLAALYERGVPLDLITILIDKSRMPEELLFITYTLLQDDMIPVLKNVASKKSMKNALTIVIEQFMRERIDPERIFELYYQLRCKSSQDEAEKTMRTLDARIKLFANESATKSIRGFIKDVAQSESSFRKRSKFLNAPVDRYCNEVQSFMLKQLFALHVRGDGIKELLRQGKLGEIKAKLAALKSGADEGTQTAKITQDIEAGSEKSPIEASIIESLQNSIDAARSTLKVRQEAGTLLAAGVAKPEQLATILYKLEMVDSTSGEANKSHFCLTLRDFVGFPTLETLLTDFILPDYSNKSPALGNIGDMGNGSFKMYQNAEKVAVLTRLLEKPDKAYLLTITPHRDAAGLVQDLCLTCDEVPVSVLGVNSAFFGTSIRILFRSSSVDKTIMDLLYAKDFLSSSVGVTQVELPGRNPVQVLLEEMQASTTGNNVERPWLARNKRYVLLNEPVCSQERLIWHVSGDTAEKYAFRVRSRVNDLSQSFVTTNGIPFRPLRSVVKQMNLLPASLAAEMSLGYVIDIGLGMYQPVQSRTQLQMTSEQKVAIKKALLEGAFIAGLRRGVKDTSFLNTRFTHFNSGSSAFDQLKLSEVTSRILLSEILPQFLKDISPLPDISENMFFDYFKPAWSNKSFSRFINDEITVLAPQIDKQKQEALKRWREKFKVVEQSLASFENMTDDQKKVYRTSLQEQESSASEKLRKDFIDQKNIIFDTWKRSIVLDRYGLASSVVIPWFDKKVANIDIYLFSWMDFIKEKHASWKTARESHVDKTFDREWEALTQRQDWDLTIIKKVMNESLLEFCKVHLEIAGKSANLNQAIFYYKPFDEVLGFYHPSEKSLNINLMNYSVAGYLGLLATAISGEDLSNNQQFKEFFLPAVGVTPTLVHELEHARRAESHDSGVHAAAYDPDNNYVDFNSCANNWMRNSLRSELLIRWKNKLSQASIRLISSFRRAIANLECYDKAKLLKNLGFES